MKTKTRILAEKIQAITGESLLQINHAASQMIQMGLAKNREQALAEILEAAIECN